MLGAMPLLSQAIAYASMIEESNCDKTAYLPQIRKLKEFKVNFHKLAKR